MKNLKRTLTIFTAFAMIFCNSLPAFASSDKVDVTVDTEATVTSEVMPTASAIVGFNSNTFSGTHGEVNVYLDTSLWGANFSCAVNGDPSGTYYCTIRLPNGDVKELGWINGNGHGTNKDNLWLAYAPAGTYTFYCNGTGGSNLSIFGTIFD